jgi:uncharacterized protein YggT (Ycf19 family)
MFDLKYIFLRELSILQILLCNVKFLEIIYNVEMKLQQHGCDHEIEHLVCSVFSN